jgi:limonene-1,2-epoxide hydrolase
VHIVEAGGASLVEREDEVVSPNVKQLHVSVQLHDVFPVAGGEIHLGYPNVFAVHIC